MLRGIKTMWHNVVAHFHRERDLNRVLSDVHEAAHKIVVSKRELDRALQDRHNADQFEDFARDARKARW